MGSPYAVMRSDRVSVVRTYRGFTKVIARLDNIIHGRFAPFLASCTDFESLRATAELFMDEVGSAEARLIYELTYEASNAAKLRTREVLFLEARYEWTGWERFQSAVVLDFSGKIEPTEE